MNKQALDDWIMRPDEDLQADEPSRQVNELLASNRRHFQNYSIKPEFNWCEICVAAKVCYFEGDGPNCLEPACGRGPMTEDEIAG